jgi:hypothetical protein
MSQLDTHKVCLIISPIHYKILVYRKARGPYRYLQHTPVIQVFPQLESPSIAVTPVIGIIHSAFHCTPVSCCSAVHSCVWLIAVLRVSRPTCYSLLWMHVLCTALDCSQNFLSSMRGKKTHRGPYRYLQHTPARTYSSPSCCMRSKSQLRLPACQLKEIPTSVGTW